MSKLPSSKAEETGSHLQPKNEMLSRRTRRNPAAHIARALQRSLGGGRRLRSMPVNTVRNACAARPHAAETARQIGGPRKWSDHAKALQVHCDCFGSLACAVHNPLMRHFRSVAQNLPERVHIAKWSEVLILRLHSVTRREPVMRVRMGGE